MQMPLNVGSSSHRVPPLVKHPGESFMGHLAPRANFHYNASSLFFCKLSVQKREEISLVLFRAQDLGSLKFGKLF